MFANSLESIEFLDYIFDRYVFLSVEQTAGDGEIRRVIRDRKVQNHPDRFEFAEERVKAEARRNWDALIRCEDVLLNPELRPAYDERLARFREQNPSLISEDGTEIANLGNPRHQVNIKYLLSGETFDIGRIIEQAVALSGHTPEKVARARRLYEREPEDRDLKDIYRDALEKQFAYHDAIEDWLWAVAGVLGKRKDDDEAPLFDSALLQKKVAGQIAHVRDTLIPRQVERREALQALGYDKNPVLLLTHAGKEITATIDKTVTNEAIGQAQTRFDALSDAIKKNTAEKAKAIENILSLGGFSLLHKADSNNVIVHLLKSLEVGQEPDDAVVAISMVSVETEAGHVLVDMVKNFEGIPYGELKTGPFDRTAAVIFYNPAIREPTLCLGYAYKLIGQAFGKQYTLDSDLIKNASDEPGHNASRPVTRPDSGTEIDETLG